MSAAQPPREPTALPPGEQSLGGQTGSIATSGPCPSTIGCEQFWRDAVDRLEQAQPIWTVVSSECTRHGKQSRAVAPVPFCICTFADGSDSELELSLFNRKTEDLVQPIPCDMDSRKGGCLIELGTIERCDDAQPESSCTDTCELAARLHNEIDAPAATVHLLASQCGRSIGNPNSARCGVDPIDCMAAIEIDGRCWGTDGGLGERSYDCSLGAQGILAAETHHTCDYRDDDDGGTTEDGGR